MHKTFRYNSTSMVSTEKIMGLSLNRPALLLRIKVYYLYMLFKEMYLKYAN